MPELCNAMFGLEAGALDRGGGRGREQELVCGCTCIVGRGPPERITLSNSSYAARIVSKL